MITELRRYRIKPDHLEDWVEFFREAGPRNEAGGSVVEFAGIDRETHPFIWLRTDADEADRETCKEAFYGADWWVARETATMDHVVEYDVTFLETVFRREGGTLTEVPWPVPGERAGSRPTARRTAGPP